ncbi:MAG: hypothetical protein JSS83_03555 [Cyanobacteria bacterium SZAS LIN-3]|nr:hypothetical protein [Cyanobacteria bacterium SZAS LIN-3]
MDDVYHYFCSTNVWAKAAAFKRDQADCLLELKGIAPSNIASIHDLLTLQFATWHEIAYAHFEASSVTLYKEASVLRFITAPDNKSCFTGRIVIGGEHYFRVVGKRLGRLPAAPFPVDFTDVEESLLSASEAYARNELARKAEHPRRIANAIQTAERITDYTSAGRQGDLKSRLLRDALMFNLHQLYRECIHLEGRRYTGVREWRERLRAVPGFTQMSDSVEMEAVWSLCVTEVPELLKLIKSAPDEWGRS